MIFMTLEPRTWNLKHGTQGRRLVRAALGVLVAGMTLSASFAAPETNSYPTLDSFQIIGTKNIFDPNRYRLRETTSQAPRTRLNAFALVGTMSYSKGQFAFFDGTSSDYKKVIEPGGNVAGYTVKEITQDAVTLAANGKEFQMKVGTQMRNQGNNKWLLAGHIIDDTPDESTNGSTGENAAAAAESATPPAAGSPEMSDVLKRLMQQRQQELK
jgi:hypothetical protein